MERTCLCGNKGFIKSRIYLPNYVDVIICKNCNLMFMEVEQETANCIIEKGFTK